jgi:hypothetical protein
MKATLAHSIDEQRLFAGPMTLSTRTVFFDDMSLLPKLNPGMWPSDTDTPNAERATMRLLAPYTKKPPPAKVGARSQSVSNEECLVPRLFRNSQFSSDRRSNLPRLAGIIPCGLINSVSVRRWVLVRAVPWPLTIPKRPLSLKTIRSYLSVGDVFKIQIRCYSCPPTGFHRHDCIVAKAIRASSRLGWGFVSF